MKKFKTNITCGGCINAVSPTLNNDDQIKSWKVDIDSPEKIMEIDTELSKDELNERLGKVGYKVEDI